MTKHGDLYENSICTYITFDNKNKTLTLKIIYEFFEFVEIPFYVLFKIFGIHDEEIMIDMIVQYNE